VRTLVRHLVAPSAAASKHALLGPTKATASDYAQHGVRINAVAILDSAEAIADGVYDQFELCHKLARPVQSPPTRGHEPALSPRPMGAKESGLATSQSDRQEAGAWLSSSPGVSHS
jgi:NAD(P)-dependent dehydrogenase (short-subunit alcohol dehydrogenase family)